MTRILSVILALYAGAAPAQTTPMTQAQCDGAWARFIDVSYSMIPDLADMPSAQETQSQLEDVESGVTPDGWCQIRADQPVFESDDFDLIRWRADDIDGFINGNGLPSVVSAQFEGLSIEDDPGYHLTFSVQRVPDAGQLLINDAVLTSPDGATLSAAAVIGGAYFRNIANMASSLGGMHLLRADVGAQVTPRMIEKQFPDLVGADFTDTINALSFEQLDRASRRALLDFERALPAARGVLTARLRSERGLGFLQFGMAMWRDQGPDALAFALSGVTTQVAWQPE